MGRKIQGQLQIDGVAVDISQARFADTFDVVDVDTTLLAAEEEVVYVVVARVSVPSFREGKGGEVKRVDVLKVKEARLIRDEDDKIKVLDAVGFDYRPQPSMIDQSGAVAAEPSITPADEEDLEPEILDTGTVVAQMVTPDDEPEVEDPSREDFLAKVQHAREVVNEEEERADELLRRPKGKELQVGDIADVKPGDHVGGASANDEQLRKFLAS